MPLLILILLVPLPSLGFLNFVGEQAKKAAEVAAYVDAASELVTDIAPDENIESSAKDIRKRSEALRAEASNLRYLSRSTQAILKGPDWSSKRLETNIRATTDYIRRLKRLVARAAILGTDGTTALNTTETNVALNEIQKNQQTLILQNAELQLHSLEQEKEAATQWSAFSSQQRRHRNKKGEDGKLH